MKVLTDEELAEARRVRDELNSQRPVTREQADEIIRLLREMELLVRRSAADGAHRAEEGSRR